MKRPGSGASPRTYLRRVYVSVSKVGKYYRFPSKLEPKVLYYLP